MTDKITFIYRDALIAIEARIKGVFDNRCLMEYGHLGIMNDDILRIIRESKQEAVNILLEGDEPLI